MVAITQFDLEFVLCVVRRNMNLEKDLECGVQGNKEISRDKLSPLSTIHLYVRPRNKILVLDHRTSFSRIEVIYFFPPPYLTSPTTSLLCHHQFRQQLLHASYSLKFLLCFYFGLVSPPLLPPPFTFQTYFYGCQKSQNVFRTKDSKKRITVAIHG